MVRESNPSFRIWLLLAAILHAILLTFVRVVHSPHPPARNAGLSVSLSESAGVPDRKSGAFDQEPLSFHPPKKLVPPSGETDLHSNANQPEYPAQSVTTLAPTRTDEEKDTKLIPANASSDNPHINLQEMLDKAHQIAHDDGLRLEKMQRPARNKEPVSQPTLTAAIGKAFEAGYPAGQPKITQFADGMIEVLTAYGTRYCLMPPKDFEKGGPVEAQAIPMTCP